MKVPFDHEKLEVYQAAIRFAACLDVLVAKKKRVCAEQGKELLVPVVSMLVGLIRSTSSDRVHEEPAEYPVG